MEIDVNETIERFLTYQAQEQEARSKTEHLKARLLQYFYDNGIENISQDDSIDTFIEALKNV